MNANRPPDYRKFAEGAGMPEWKPPVDEIDDEPGPDAPYSAFWYEMGARQVVSLHICFNAAEILKYKKRRIQLQYSAMCIDDDQCGLAADGRSFSYVFADIHGKVEITVHGTNLEKGWRYSSFHKVKRIMSADRPATKPDEEYITGIEVTYIKEE